MNKNSDPLVTVLISTYNRPGYLRQALRSIFNQTYPNFEIILTRDGGLPVRDAIQEFLGDSRLVFIDRDENRGLPYSFNRAMERARGEYICYLGDDDIFYPNHIEVLLRAMLSQDRCGVVYSDLYKTHCRVTGDGRRLVLAKNLEISRDFDRMLMLQFNHVLHVSLMHRKDLLERAGGYNEDLNVLIDWDLTHRLCFYTDFLHVPVVTGEYFAPVGECDRISVQRRKDKKEYLRNVRTIRRTRPPKPWDCMKECGIIFLCDRADEVLTKIEAFRNHSFYPHQIYLPLCRHEISKLGSYTDSIKIIETPGGLTDGQRVDLALKQGYEDYMAVISADLKPEDDEAMFFERSLYPLMTSKEGNVGFEMVESSEAAWGAVFRRQELFAARLQNSRLGLKESVEAAGIKLRKPAVYEYPFLFDTLLGEIGLFEKQGDWKKAAIHYEAMGRKFGNMLWMKTLYANSLLHLGDYQQAAQLACEINRIRPSVSTLQMEARSRAKMRDWAASAKLLEECQSIVNDCSFNKESKNPVQVCVS